MIPADQGLGADQAAIGQMHLRLVEQFEFISFCSQRQFGFQCQTRLELVSYRILEQNMAAAFGGLGAAQRQMAVAQEFVGGTAAGGEHRCADGNADAMLALTGEQWRVEGGADPRRAGADIIAETVYRKYHCEFIATQSRDCALARHCGGQAL